MPIAYYCEICKEYHRSSSQCPHSATSVSGRCEEDIEKLAETFECMFRVVDRQLPLEKYTSEELLFCLLMREGFDEAPVKRVFGDEHYDAVIGIGKDHTANITLSKLDYEALEDMLYEQAVNNEATD